MPLILATGVPASTAWTFSLPAAVVAVCVPWPSESRGEMNSPGTTLPAPKPSTK